MAKHRKSEKIQLVRGMQDILPAERKYWDYFYAVAIPLAEIFGFRQIETPILESIKLFKRGVGQGTDIVEKEMFELKTKGGDYLALRPEPTAPIMRAYIEHGMHTLSQPVKLYYFGPIFRYERPQKGRQREFRQFDIEAIGSAQAVIDAQIIVLGWQILDSLGFSKNLLIQINSIGCAVCRPNYINVLQEYYRGKTKHLCPDCRTRLKKNPLRLLDCKGEKCQRLASGAPNSVDYLCNECKEHFQETLGFLDELDLVYILNYRLVRGLDYYTKTVFEFSDKDNPSFAYGGGGRYDSLAEVLGGRPTPAVGFGLGLERLIGALKDNKKIKVPEKIKPPQVFLAQLGQYGKIKAFKLFIELLRRGISVHESFSRNTLKSQLKLADKLQARFVLIMGQKEALEDSVILRNMETRVQEIWFLNKVADEIKKRLTS